MTVTIEREEFNAKLHDEMLPLAQKCWNESTVTKADTCAYYGERDFKIEPDREMYQGLADKGSLIVVILRDQGKIQGYVIGFLYRSMHHRNILCGIGDSAYLEPEYRSYMAVVAERFEREFRSHRVNIIGWPVHVNGPIYAVLKARGYVGDDIVMEKRLCV